MKGVPRSANWEACSIIASRASGATIPIVTPDASRTSLRWALFIAPG